MKFLLCNDDGYFAPGLAALAKALSALGDVVVVAPERDKSGASNSLTLDRPLMVRRAANGFYYVNGTPSDCVHLAVTGFLDSRPDLVVSGINHGPNMGDDTLYSGTVAAATEGFLLGIPSLAVSLAGRSDQNFHAAAQVASQLVDKFHANPFTVPMLLNLNVPDLPSDEIKGIKVTRLGKRHPAEPAVKSHNPRGDTIYWVGAVGNAQDAAEGTDFHAVASGYASLTPLMVDLTAHGLLSTVETWLHR